MDIERNINQISNILNNSPIRQHLKNNNKISLFESERNILNDIDKIMKVNKENLQNKLKVVILGEVKAGKSTLINSLIGKKVSYTNVLEATASILEIKYSKEEKVLIYKVDGNCIKLKSLGELNKLIDANKENQEFFAKINKIVISTNIDKLKDLILVDTPGLNTVTSENEEKTENYIANSDVILWVINSHHLGQTDIVEKIEKVLDYGKPIICVLNRIDEIDADKDELIEYVENEMWYMFSEIFAISAKQAWDGYCKKDISKIQESNINELYDYLINDIERNANDVQMNSILESIKTQVMRDLIVHQKTQLRLNIMLESFQKDKKELEEFNERIKEIINNKLSEWLDKEFFKKERILLKDCDKDKEFNNLIKEYTSEDYINRIVNDEYENLQEFIINEWKNNTEEFLKRQHIGGIDIELETLIDLDSIIETENIKDNNIVDGIKQGGITASALGIGLAGYSAWIGPAAAYVSIGSAVATFVPPLLIAGAIAGGTLKVIESYKRKNDRKNDRYKQIEDLDSKIKDSFKKNVLYKMKKNLYDMSDYYLENSFKIITSILEQCNITIDEVIKINSNIKTYINEVDNISYM